MTAALDLETVRSRMNYDPSTGLLTWRISGTNRTKVGDQVGGYSTQFYRQTYFCGDHHKVHRIIWLHFYGEQPPERIDHINGIRDDNRIINLRAITNQENSQNRRNSRVPGRALGARPLVNGKWTSSIRIGPPGNTSRIHLGTFGTEDEAYEAYVAAKRIYHKGNTL